MQHIVSYGYAHTWTDTEIMVLNTGQQICEMMYWKVDHILQAHCTSLHPHYITKKEQKYIYTGTFNSPLYLTHML